MNTQPITLASIEAYCFRVPVQTPIKVAFGTFRDRPFVLVHVVDTDGAEGWGKPGAIGPPSAPSIGRVWWSTSASD